MPNELINDGMMDPGMMMVCMIASALFAIVILVLLIIQTVLQAKILRAVRSLHEKTPAATAGVRTGDKT